MTQIENKPKSAVDDVIFPAELAKLKGVNPQSIYRMCKKWKLTGHARQDSASGRQGWIIDRAEGMRYIPSQKPIFEWL